MGGGKKERQAWKEVAPKDRGLGAAYRKLSVAGYFFAGVRFRPMVESDAEAEMVARLVRRGLVALVCLACVILGSLWWFTRETPGRYRYFFNSIYRYKPDAFTHEPNRLLMETVSPLSPGRALDIAMGQGRNAVYLAKKGWDVTGFDVSDEALRQAEANAASAGVRLKVTREGCVEFDYGHERWDLIVLCYAFVPIRDPAYVQRIHESLKPGGLVVFEHYIRAPGMTERTGTPDRGQLIGLFKNFDIRKHEELEARSDWQGQRRTLIARLVAAKPR